MYEIPDGDHRCLRQIYEDEAPADLRPLHEEVEGSVSELGCLDVDLFYAMIEGDRDKCRELLRDMVGWATDLIRDIESFQEKLLS